MTEEVHICNPCKDGTHAECELKGCDCIVCLGERIGDQVVGDPLAVKHPIPDRFNPRPWR